MNLPGSVIMFHALLCLNTWQLNTWQIEGRQKIFYKERERTYLNIQIPEYLVTGVGHADPIGVSIP